MEVKSDLKPKILELGGRNVYNVIQIHTGSQANLRENVEKNRSDLLNPPVSPSCILLSPNPLGSSCSILLLPTLGVCS